jgi:hypothetical protein
VRYLLVGRRGGQYGPWVLAVAREKPKRGRDSQPGRPASVVVRWEWAATVLDGQRGLAFARVFGRGR